MKPLPQTEDTVPLAWLTTDGKAWSMMSNAACVQVVQVAFWGMFGILPASTWDTSDSRLSMLSVPVDCWILFSVSVTHSVLLFAELHRCQTGD